MNFIVFVTSIFASSVSAEIWQKDLSSDISIGESNSGYKKVHLRCGADYMQVDVETEEDFGGVIYTRGSFHNRQSPCFLDPRQGRAFSLKFPLSKCQTKHEDEVYSNIVVIQQDDELIMPGDAAFTVECDFSRPRDFTVNANLATGKHDVSSRITLTDADPAAQQQPRHKRSTVSNDSDTVVFTPEDVRSKKAKKKKSKDEL